MRHFFNACPGSDDKAGASPVVSLAKATTDTTPASTCTGGRRSAEENGAAASAGTNGEATSALPQKPQVSSGAPGSCPEWYAGLRPGNNQRRPGDRQGLSGREPGTPDREVDSPSPLNPYADHGELHNSAIKYPVTVGHKVAFPSVIAVRDIAYVMNCVKTGIVEGKDIRALIHTLRNVPNSDLVRAMKKELPYFLGSVCQRVRSNATVQFAHFAIFDLDHVQDIKHLRATACLSLPFIRYAFRSVRDGVKLIAQFKDAVEDESEYRLAWQHLASRIEREFGLPVDPAPDWARACFYSYDPDLKENRNYCPFDAKLAQLPDWLDTPQIKASMGVIPGLARLSHSGLEPESSPFRTARQPETQRLDPGSATPRSGDPGVRDDSAEERQASPPAKAQGANSCGVSQRGTFAAPRSASAPDSSLSTAQPLSTVPPLHLSISESDFERARAVVKDLATKVIPYSDWIKCGHALYSGFGESGRELWLIFQSNPHYRDTERVLDTHWRSFARVRSVTLASLFYIGGKYGCA